MISSKSPILTAFNLLRNLIYQDTCKFPLTRLLNFPNCIIKLECFKLKTKKCYTSWLTLNSQLEKDTETIWVVFGILRYYHACCE